MLTIFFIPGVAVVNTVLPQMGIVGGKYRYMQDLLQLDACRPYAPSSWCTLLSTPLKLQQLETYLRRHPDQQYASYLHTRLANGFRVGFDRTVGHLRSTPHNHPSALERPDIVTYQVTKEVGLGRLTGLFHTS